MIRAVLFDFDGVIVLSEAIHKKTFTDMLSTEMSDERWYQEFAGIGSRRIFAKLLKELGKEGDLDELVEKRRELFNGYVKKGKVKEMPGLRKFLSAVRKNGIKTAIVSGGHLSYITPILDMLGIQDHFDFIVSADEIPYRKPDPRPFLIAAEKLGVKADECLVVEDSYSGCKAARTAGMKLVWLSPKPSMEPPDCDIIIENLKDKNLEKLIEF